MKEKTRVLVVEDREEHQKLFKRILEKLGFEYILARSVEETKLILARQSFHIALVDLSLEPDNDKNRDGLVAITHIKNTNEETVVLVLTAYGDVMDADKAFTQYGIAGFIPKIASVNDIMARITDAVEKAKLERNKPSRRLINTSLIFENPAVVAFGDSQHSAENKLRFQQQLDGLIRRLLLDFYPLIPRKEGFVEIRKFNATSYLEINYWSKILGDQLTAFIWVTQSNDEREHLINHVKYEFQKDHALDPIVVLNESFDTLSSSTLEGIVLAAQNNDASDYI